MPRKWMVLVLLVAALGMMTQGCTEEETSETKEVSVEQQQKATAHYAALVHAGYVETERRVGVLAEAVDALVAAPSESTLQAARDAWNDAREIYGQTEGFRFYSGPIDADGGPEERLNAWPLDENFVDYTRPTQPPKSKQLDSLTISKLYRQSPQRR